MLSFIFKRFADRPYKKFIKKSQPTIDRINELEEKYQQLSDAELRHNTEVFRERLAAGETLEDILPEAFATVKNAARRLCGQTHQVNGHPLEWNMVHYDVQLLGGLALHSGKIAEMATGEGKTLVATLPLYLNALPGRGCHCVTVNDYLANRDSEWMGYLFKFLGLTVGCIQNSMPLAQKKEMYQADITYGTASEFGFDYLRDNGMAMVADAQVQRDHFYCIVDEVDSIRFRSPANCHLTNLNPPLNAWYASRIVYVMIWWPRPKLHWTRVSWKTSLLRVCSCCRCAWECRRTSSSRA